MNGGAQEFAMNLAIPTENVLVQNITVRAAQGRLSALCVFL